MHSHPSLLPGPTAQSFPKDFCSCADTALFNSALATSGLYVVMLLMLWGGAGELEGRAVGSVASTNSNAFETEGEERERNRTGTGVRRGGDTRANTAIRHRSRDQWWSCAPSVEIGQKLVGLGRNRSGAPKSDFPRYGEAAPSSHSTDSAPLPSLRTRAPFKQTLSPQKKRFRPGPHGNRSNFLTIEQCAHKCLLRTRAFTMPYT